MTKGMESGELRTMDKDSLMHFMLSVGYSVLFMDTFLSIVVGIDFGDPDQWKRHRAVLKSILEHALLEESK